MATAERSRSAGAINRNAYYKSRRRELKAQDAVRTCAEDGCGTVLSRYNYNKCCHVHNFAYVCRNKVHLNLNEIEVF